MPRAKDEGDSEMEEDNSDEEEEEEESEEDRTKPQIRMFGKNKN